MGHIGNEGNGVHGVWVTLAMGTQGAMGYRGIGYVGNETNRGKVVQGVWVQGVWGTCPIRPTGGMGYRGTGGIGHMGNRA